MIQEQIEAFYLLFNITTDNCHIAPFQTSEVEYVELQLLHVQLRSKYLSKTQLQALAESIHKAIPYPLILVFEFQQQIQFSLAEKRINQLEQAHDKLVLQDVVQSGWIDLSAITDIEDRFFEHITFNRLSRQNMMVLYKDIVRAIIALNMARKTGEFQWLDTDEAQQEQHKRLIQIQSVEKQITELTNKMNKESQFNLRVEMSMQIKQLKQELSRLSNKE